MTNEPHQGDAVAIVGMACRFPGASTPEEFFENLLAGFESLVPESEWAKPDFVAVPARLRKGAKAVGLLRDIDQLDAAYFGLTPREAEVMDPQQRLFLECAAEALQRAGHDGGPGADRVGVYAGVGINTYYLRHVLTNPRVMQGALAFQAVASNEKDFVATQTSYRLDLRGPSLSIHTACSTSLVAIATAFDALLAHQCDVALAGGSSVKPDPSFGFFLDEGGIGSPDGVCRAFDAKANGTVGGSGVGVVALKRLSDALAQGDPIHAVIRGAAVNNDGAAKPGYTAPSVEGQAAVVAEALAVAGVEPSTIGYVETHGTGTPVGDPIEVAALARVFGQGGDERGVCALGAVKTNIGHLDAAAGVAGLIKAALALERGLIPPTLHHETPNPALRLHETPFRVNTRTEPLAPRHGAPRRAGVSSFGIGGTNAHVVLEEAPPRAASTPAAADTRPQVLVLSARTPTALDAMARRLADALERGDAPLADAAWTLQVGRRRLAHRRAVVAATSEEAVAILRGGGPARRTFGHASDARERPVAFLFPGQGAQHIGMARRLYETEPVFRRELDRCAELLLRHLAHDVRTTIFPSAGGEAEAEALLAETLLTQPALFAVEYALARQWIKWGIRPTALIGHSLGEYVAATLAGVFTLEDATALVAARARLLQATPQGAMLAVAADEEVVRAALLEIGAADASVAAVNAPGTCVASGAPATLTRLAERLAERGIEVRPLHVRRAFHSPLVHGALADFEEAVRKVQLHAPKLPVVSNVTGDWLTPAQATDPLYWVRHVREPVRFADGLSKLLAQGDLALLEVGPGRTLTSLAAGRADATGRTGPVLASLPHPKDLDARDDVTLREALARLWLAGATPDWARVHAPTQPRRARLPAYPWERQRYWLPATTPSRTGAPADIATTADDSPTATTTLVPTAPSAAEATHARPPLANAYVAASSPLEEALVELWESAFGFRGIGVHDDFFDLGGHSLLATRITSGIRTTFDVEIDLAQMFEVRTIAQLAGLVEDRLVAKLEAMSDEEAAQRLAS